MAARVCVLAVVALFSPYVRGTTTTGANDTPTAPRASAINVSVTSNTQQELRGWGTSLCWWPLGVGNWKNATKFEELMTLLFSPRELGLNQVRYNIGGGEALTNLHFMRPGGAVPGFLRANMTYDWDADYAQRRVLTSAIRHGVEILHAFSNSPPAFMTKSGSSTGAEGGASNLASSQFGAFTTYLADVVQHFATHFNITFDYVTPLNEPNSPWWKYGNDQEGCHVGPEDQSSLVVDLANKLTSLGVSTRVSAPEENSLDQTLTSLHAYGGDALSALGLISTHTYNGEDRAALASFARAHNIPLWNSEYGSGSQPLQGSFDVANRIVSDLRQLNVTVWTLWQAGSMDQALSQSGWALTGATFHEEHLFYLRNFQGQCLVLPHAADGADFTFAPCAGTADQIFSITSSAILARNSSGVCMDAWNGSLVPGERVSAYSCWGGANQRWWPDEASGTVRLDNRSGLCLAQDGQRLRADTCDGSAAQRWSFISVADGIDTPTGRVYWTDEQEESYIVRKQYYGYKQFTHFIRKYDRILDIQGDPNMQVLAALKPNGTLVLVGVNPGSAPLPMTAQLPPAFAGTSGTTFQTSETLNCEQIAQQPVTSDGRLTADLPAETITTWVINPAAAR